MGSDIATQTRVVLELSDILPTLTLRVQRGASRQFS
ncbi:hypothetical protein ACVWZI_002782 [Thermostichus sp. OS-CIW-28]